MTINLRKILLVDEFLQSWRAIKREKWRYLFLFFQFVIIADMWKYCRDDTLLVFNCILSGFLAIRQVVEWKKILYVMLVYALMLVAPIWMYGINELMLRQYVGYAIRILTGCFIASYFCRDFISKFENLVFVLAYISIPLFILQVIEPSVYDIFTPISKAIMVGGKDADISRYSVSMHQYILVYVLNSWDYKRNSGFMWEPGAFAMMITWASLFLIYLNRFQWHRRLIPYILAMLTTFSLLGYLCIIVLLVLFLAQKSDWSKIIYSFVGGGILLFLLMQTPLFREQQNMMMGKAHIYMYDSEKQLYRGESYLNTQEETKEVGRLAQFYILGDIIRENPFGIGMNTERYSAPNGLINLIVKWGVNAIIILAFSFYFFSKRLTQIVQKKVHWYIILMTMIVFVMPVISNPIYNAVLFMAMLCFPFVAKRQIF